MQPTGQKMTSKVVRAIRVHRLGVSTPVEGRPPSRGRAAFEKLVLRLMGGRYGRRRF